MHDEERPRSLSKTPTSNQEPASRTQQHSSVEVRVLRGNSEAPSNKRTPEADDRLPEPWIPNRSCPSCPRDTRIPALSPLFARFYLQTLCSQDFTQMSSSQQPLTPMKPRFYVRNTKNLSRR